MKRALLTFLFFLPLWCVAQGRSAAEYPLGDTLRYDPVPYEVDLKTNLLMDATATINLGVEFPLGRRWSMDVSGNYNGWTLSDNRKWKHWMVQPEFRFWTKTRQRGHFIGIHLLGGEYNLNRMHLPFKMYPSTADRRHEGWGVGAGFTYGYRWNFSERWGMEGQLGLGWIYTEYDKFCPKNCGVRVSSGSKHWFGPTKIALNLIYRFGKKNRMAEAARLAALNAPKPIIEERIVRDTVIIRDTVVIHASEPARMFRNETYILHLQYEAGSAKIVRTLADNGERLAAFKEFIDRIQGDSTVVIQRISLTGYCSIEGTAQYNDRLSSTRAHTLRSPSSRSASCATRLSFVIPSLSMLLSQPECSATKLTSCICSTRLAAPKSCVHWPTMGSAWPLSKSSLTGYREIRQSSSSVFL